MKTHEKLLLEASLAGLAALGGLVFLVAPGRASKKDKKPFMYKNFAHRGLHKKDKTVPENSLAAFERASSYGYGMELDVQLSKDGQVVVFHDDTLNRVCGVDSRVDEKTYDELSKISLCGTTQTIPLFSEVLKTVRGRGPLIVELKRGRRNIELCEKTYALLAEYRGDVCIESFDPFIVAWFRFHAPELLRGQLAMPAGRYENFPKPLAFALSHGLMNFVCRPQFMAYRIGHRPLTVHIAEMLGAMKVAWTSHEPKNERGKDAVIFEFYKPSVKFAPKRK